MSEQSARCPACKKAIDRVRVIEVLPESAPQSSREAIVALLACPIARSQSRRSCSARSDSASASVGSALRGQIEHGCGLAPGSDAAAYGDQRSDVGHGLAIGGAAQPDADRIQFAHKPRDIGAGVLDPISLQ